MEVREDIQIGDIVPFYTKPFGETWMKCMDVQYGVVIGFTINNNPRVTPIYYKQKQNFSYKGAFKWIKRTSVIMPKVFKISNPELFLQGGIRQINYDSLLRMINRKENQKIQPVQRSTESYFTFD